MGINMSFNELFEQSVTFPDISAQERLNRLVGLDSQKDMLNKMISLHINPSGLESWFHSHHPRAKLLLKTLLHRPPLVVLAGDVGTGKSELAETIGDSVARQEGIEVSLFPLSLSTRGQGRVGEMTQLISAAFQHTIMEASKVKSESGKNRGGVILLIDEADALAQSREASQMHHEDRAGVNALIRGVDRISNNSLPAVVLMCTNRLNALDPAIKRRAVNILIFERPNIDQRKTVLTNSLAPLGFDDAEIDVIVNLTGSMPERAYGFTYSDLTQRLLPAMILSAYPDGPVNTKVAIKKVYEMIPTPPFQENI